MRAAAGEGIFQKVEHGEEFALWHEDMVAKEAVQSFVSREKAIVLAIERAYPAMTE